MDQKISRKFIAIAVLVAIVLAGFAFFAGYSVGRHSLDAEIQEKQELETTLSLSELEGLKSVEGTIYVTGHKSPDSDSVCSAIAYATLLQKLGYDARPVVLGDINKESEFILDAAGAEVPELLEDASGKNMILVDHSEYEQSAEGLEDANVVGIIDHHGDGSVRTGNQLVYDARPMGSTATIIWIDFRDYGVEIDKQTAFVLLGAILSDTKNLKSDNTTSADKEAVSELSEQVGIDDVDAFYTDIYKAFISHEGMTDEEIFFSDYKEFESKGKKFCIACVDVYDQDEAEDMAKRMKNVMPEMLKKTGMDMAFAHISIYHDDLSFAYLVPAGEAEQEVLEEAFGELGTFDGTSFVCEPGFSRRQVTVPYITDVLAAHPSE